MSEKLEVLQHALGVDEYGEGRQYRSYYVAGPGHHSWDVCCKLTAMGLMQRHKASAISGGDPVFIVTPKGVDYVALNSPKKPKLTRSQQRYQDFLDADCGYSFREWLRVAV